MKNIVGALILLLCVCWAGDGEPSVPAPLNITAHDRLLVLAPHPDDEALGVGGVIHKAVQENIPLKIVYLTYGDTNAYSFIVNQKRLVVRRNAVLMMGHLRGQESVDGMSSLGVTKEQLVFLGYPDWRTENIFKSFWGDQKPLKSLLTRVRHVPYEDALSPGAPHSGESILQDIRDILEEFRPTKIFVSHPRDGNRDHRAFFLFLQAALWDLEDTLPTPDIYAYLIHWRRWPQPAQYDPQEPLTAPADWPEKNSAWVTFFLNEEVRQKKHDAISFFKTQTDYNARYLYSFVKKNELFERMQLGDLSYPGARLVNRKETVFVSREDDVLVFTLKSRFWQERNTKVRFILIGHKRGVPFAQASKIRVDVDVKQKKVTTQRCRRNGCLTGVEVDLYAKGSDLVIRVSKEDLQYPDYGLLFLNSNAPDLKGQGGWRLMRLSAEPLELAQKENPRPRKRSSE